MAVFVAAHGEKGISRRLWTIWEHGAKKPEVPAWVTVTVSRTGTRTVVYNNNIDKNTEKKNMTIYSGRTTRSRCKETMNNCYNKAIYRSMKSKSIQKRSDGRRAAVREYYLRRSERLVAKMMERMEAFMARMDEREQRPTGLIKESVVQDLKERPELTRSSLNKQTTNNDKPLGIPAYSFMARKSLFPDPKHCNSLPLQPRKHSMCSEQK